MTKRFALLWLWFIVSLFFTAIIIPKSELHNWKVFLTIFISVALTIEAIYITVK